MPTENLSQGQQQQQQQQQQQRQRLRIWGLDVGTMNIVLAHSTGTGETDEIEYRMVRNMFLPLSQDRFLDRGLGQEILKEGKIRYVEVGEHYYVLGEDAHQLANLLNEEPHRPLQAGVLNPREPMRIAMVRELLRGLIPPLSKAKDKDKVKDVICLSIPADPLTGEFSTAYHERMLVSLVEDLGFPQPQPIKEGVAVVYAALADHDYTGLGLSLGSGMVNFALAYKGIEVFSFSLLQAGDWIDEQAAKMVNRTANYVTAVKENSEQLDLAKPLLELPEVEQAISIQYDILLRNILRGVRFKFDRTAQIPRFEQERPLPIALAGGTTLPTGFVEKFRLALKEYQDFPLPVGEVLIADDPLRAVARGLLQAARARTRSD